MALMLMTRMQLTLLFLGLVFLVGAHSLAQAPTPVKVSSYVSAADLVSAVDTTIKNLAESTEQPADEYAEATQERVKKNALLLAVMAMNLSQHDTPNVVQPGAVAMHATAIEIAKQVKDQAAVKQLLTKLIAARAETAPATAPVPWAMVRGLGALMKKTNELSSTIKRNLEASKFEKQQANLQQQSAMLAALTQATLLDTHEVKNLADMPAWEKYAQEYRANAGELNASLGRADRAAAMKAFQAMEQSCHTCHQKFHPPK